MRSDDNTAQLERPASKKESVGLSICRCEEAGFWRLRVRMSFLTVSRLTCKSLAITAWGIFLCRYSLITSSSLNFSQFVEGRRWWPWAREGLKEAHVFAGDEPCTGEETSRAAARFDARQNVINCATWVVTQHEKKKPQKTLKEKRPVKREKQ